jgi:broad specificity phosphatase PhoE
MLLLACLAACATTAPAEKAGAIATFIVVRHAEKGLDDTRDPSLSAAGTARAQRLAGLLADVPLTAAYATAYRRTRQTAQPAADAHAIAVTAYDAKSPVAAFVSRLRATHAHGTVLVVGHSNTVPGIVAALSGVTVDAMPDEQFGRLYRIDIGVDGKATLSQESY